MPLSRVMRDMVDVLNQDGRTKASQLHANVQPSWVFIKAGTLIIEPGDLVVRHDSNGGEETYVVLDAGFYKSVDGIPANYQMKVRRIDAPTAT